MDRLLSSKVNDTKAFIKDNQNILFTKADKGNVTLAIDRSIYNKKFYMFFLMNNTISNCQKILFSVGKNQLMRWKKKWLKLGVHELDYSFDILYKNINTTNLARAYGLSKIHEKDLPVRIIVSTVNSPTYFLDKAICTFFNKYLP